MSTALFGTDGYRGNFDNSTEQGINPTTFERLSYEYAHLIKEKDNGSPVVIVGGDTRESSPVLIDAVCSGVTKAGVDAWDVGSLPTPVIAWLANKYSTYGEIVTASHNDFTCNGLKVFDKSGFKLSTEPTEELERRFFESFADNRNIGKARQATRLDMSHLYSEYLSGVYDSLGGKNYLAGKTVIIDGANGAAFEIAPMLYRALGAKVIEYACSNSGRLINNGCGAAHLEGVKSFIDEHPDIVNAADFLGAFANDGDADRVMGVDRNGRTVDGNYWLRHLAIGQIGIVGTIYTNSALRKEVSDMGVEFHECANGDQHVTEKLLQLSRNRGPGFTRGGEFTGHIIDLEHLPSGDGIYMGALMAVIMAKRGINLADIKDEMTLWPEKMMNIRLANGNAKAVANHETVREAILIEQARLGEAGRIIVRASGTEQLLRVWTEAEDGSMIDSVVDNISRVAQSV